MPKLKPEEQQEIILDGLKFSWSRSEMALAAEMWEQGASIGEIVDKVNPYHTSEGVGYSDRADEVAFLLIHLGREDKLARREGGIWA